MHFSRFTALSLCNCVFDGYGFDEYFNCNIIEFHQSFRKERDQIVGVGFFKNLTRTKNCCEIISSAIEIMYFILPERASIRGILATEGIIDNSRLVEQHKADVIKNCARFSSTRQKQCRYFNLVLQAIVSSKLYPDFQNAIRAIDGTQILNRYCNIKRFTSQNVMATFTIDKQFVCHIWVGEPEWNFGFVHDDRGQVDILQSPFFDVGFDFDDTVEEYIDRIQYDLVDVIDEQRSKGRWIIYGHPPPPPIPATSPATTTLRATCLLVASLSVLATFIR
ncbi:hypothetical protein IEQ34_020364 [Dendrobium chrysotoxum]|uniref:Uncharacterized protein n=1 Tax=Dendrobium chrysotoxum TaxID=161865 RepID=A0AAV7G2K8_DENCH|nr:hypothetical protein IEQ34_020364 [Dendrobium chrysotoxum]